MAKGKKNMVSEGPVRSSDFVVNNGKDRDAEAREAAALAVPKSDGVVFVGVGTKIIPGVRRAVSFNRATHTALVREQKAIDWLRANGYKEAGASPVDPAPVRSPLNPDENQPESEEA